MAPCGIEIWHTHTHTHTQTHTHTGTWATLSKNLERGVNIDMCAPARDEPYSEGRHRPEGTFYLYMISPKRTYVTLLLKIHCQKPPNMLSRGHRIQFGSGGLYCVAAGAKTEALVFVLLRSHIANERLARNCSTGVLEL